jgi:hypothetical protein
MSDAPKASADPSPAPDRQAAIHALVAACRSAKSRLLVAPAGSPDGVKLTRAVIAEIDAALAAAGFPD